MRLGKFRFTVVPTLAALCSIALTASLGLWQTQRGQAKEAALAQRQAQSAQEATALSQVPLTQNLTQNLGRSVQVRGTYLPNASVLLENRPHINGRDVRSGYLLLSPLQISAAAGEPVEILWVARGWLPREGYAGQQSQPQAGVRTPQGEQTVAGILAKAPSHVMQLGEDAGRAYQDPQTGERFTLRQNLDLNHSAPKLVQAVRVYPAILEEAGEPLPANGVGLARDWALPGLGAEKHFGYALQWFSLCAVLCVLTVVLAWRAGQASANQT